VSHSERAPSAPDELLELLQAQQRRFLAFLTPRLGSQDAARELLQTALLKAVERGGSLRADESATAWFFRLLRNALVDFYRHASAERRAMEGHARESLLSSSDTQALERHVCACVEGLLTTVKPEYSTAVQAVDLEGQSLGEFASAAGLSPGNARVRLHRARKALGNRLLEMCGTCCAQGCSKCPCEEAAPESCSGKPEV
jgi:RNA polymerase sigma-70 factor, ECF subfamily